LKSQAIAALACSLLITSALPASAAPPAPPLSIDIINDFYMERSPVYDYRLLIPGFGPGQVQLSWDLETWEPASAGYRWPFRPAEIVKAKIQPRLTVGIDTNSDGLDVPWIGAQTLIVAKKWDLFSAARFPTNDTRCGFFNELAVEGFRVDDWSLRANVIETHAAGRAPGWSAGPELMYWKHPVQLRFAWFDSMNDRGRNEWRFWFVIPVA
jgi:hypothetical protein